MKKLMTVLLVAILAVVLAVSASAVLYNPEYYGVEKVEQGSIVVDGAVDEAYGEPIFYFQADGTDDPGDYQSADNWFFTKDDSGNEEEVLALVQVTENYAYGYAVWTDTSLYLCVDTNILGWSYPEHEKLTAEYMWRAFSLQFNVYDFESNACTVLGLAINEADETIARMWAANESAVVPLSNDIKAEDGNSQNAQVSLNAKVTRENISHVVYEVEIPFKNVLSKLPEEGGLFGLDICVNFGDYNGVKNIQKCLTFVNANYHDRLIENARPLYLVENVEDAVPLFAQRKNQEEARKDDHSIALFGCNDVPEGTDFVLETEDVKAGLASLFLTVDPSVASINQWTIPAVDGTGWDTLEFWMYVNDPAIFDLSPESTLELGSNGKAAMSWTFAEIKALHQENNIVADWNYIALPLKETADFDITAIDYIGLSIDATAFESRVGIMLDSFRLSDDQAVLAAEDMKAAAKVEKRIDNLVEITADNYVSMNPKVLAARKEYDKLSDSAKKFVSAEMLAKLEQAEEAVAAFMENPPADEDPADPVDPGTPIDPTTPTPPVTPSNPGAKDDGGSMTVIIIVIVAVVVIAGAVVAVIVLKKKKA